MRGIKIPQQDFVLKMQGELMHEGGHICRTLRELYPSVGGDHFTHWCWA